MAKATAELDARLAGEDELSQWAGNPLAQFLAAAWRNTVHSFSAETDHYRTLAEVDAVFRALVGDAGVNKDRVSAGFLVRAHAAWLTTASLGLSGQVAQAYSLMGSVLETALQGLFISGSPERQQLWLGRNDDDNAELRADTMLDMEAALTHLHELDPATANVYAKLQARAKDRGAHPNTYANLSRTASPGAEPADCKGEYFICDNDIQRACLRSTAQVGICLLSIFYYMFGDQYRELELGERINKLRQGH
jgi:hypothetical protein